MQAGALIAGKYRVERVLGQGGMGFVFEATHVELDQLVALKTLAAETMTPEGVERFLREARSAARVGRIRVLSYFTSPFLANTEVSPDPVLQ